MADTAAPMADTAARIRAITARLGPDAATTARREQAWAKDVPRGCACPHRWDGTHWTRAATATCRVHSQYAQQIEEVRG